MSVSDSNCRHALRLVTSLFFMWGLAYGLLDVLNKHFQESLSVSRAHSAYLQAAYFGAYFLMALPAACLMRRRGYKFGILLGLCLYALGALLFAPATLCGSFDFFLLALFVIACGLACLETAANPYVAILGDPALAERRLNFAQSFNGLGSFIGPLIGGALFFTRATVGPVSMGVPVTYAAIAVVVLVIAALIRRAPLPEVVEEQVSTAASEARSLWSQGHFAGAVVAQFCYVAAQVGIGTFFINYVTEHQKSIDSSHASFLLSIGLLAFLVGRFTSTALMRRVAPSTLLTLYAVINIALCAIVALAAGPVAIAALIAIFFFMSIMFPTIFALGVARLGTQTKTGAAYLIMSIVGGAIAPYLMGLIADARGTAAAYWVPGACFAVVAWYGYAQKPGYPPARRCRYDGAADAPRTDHASLPVWLPAEGDPGCPGRAGPDPAVLTEQLHVFPFSGNSRPTLNSVWVLSCALLLPNIGTAGTIHFYKPQSVGNIRGRAYADGHPPVHWLNMSTFGQTSSAVSQTISGWNLGDFTGVKSPAPVGKYQRGINNAAYRSSALQMTNSSVGAVVNTDTIPGGSGYNYDLANAQVQYRWDTADNLKPWAYPTSNFNFAFYLQVPDSRFTGGAVGYVYASFLVDDGNGHRLWIQPQVYDVRGVNSNGIHEFIGFDKGTATVYANTLYGAGTRYCSPFSGSSSSTGTTWSGWRWYGESISRTQLLNAINDSNSKYGAGLSTDPANYTLTFISIQDEIAWSTGGGWLAFSAKKIRAYETY